MAINELTEMRASWIMVFKFPSLLTVGERIMLDKISVSPRIHFGKPCIAGTRITVQSVLELIDEGVTFAEIIADYHPDLNEDDVHACVRYAIALVAHEDIHVTAES